MRARRQQHFATIVTEGAILPADLLARVAADEKALGGLTPSDYHLVDRERIGDATNRVWNRLVGAWSSFSAARAKLGANDAGTGVTRDKWLLPLFSELGYGRLQRADPIEIDGKAYRVSHGWQRTPIHLVGCGVSIDKRERGVAGASEASPHGLVQELLNRSEHHLWAIVSNGLRLRLLRDNVSLTRQAYVEFDLEAMMDGEAYADFAVLWRLCHQSRVELLDGSDRPEDTWLEKWSRAAEQQGTRVREALRAGVEQAIAAIGAGLLRHPENQVLRDRLTTGEVTTQDYYRQLLRVVYRLLFLFVAEDRELLLAPGNDAAAGRERYDRFYGTARLRRLAERMRGSRHGDLWQAFQVVVRQLGSEDGCPGLALPALGGFLFSDAATAALARCELENADLLDAVRKLSLTEEGRVRRTVDYRNLQSEELGSVFESLLELHPELDVDSGTFTLGTAAGHERKTTGSYYTPDSLVQCLLDSALEPVLDRAAAEKDPAAAILNLKVCDPAVGSGHFLVAAAHRMARRLAAVRTGETEPAPPAVREALHDVIASSLFGVDVNPMAVELCKVYLWLEAMDPRFPLSFLDHHIQCGNSLLGATPALVAKGIPDEAFKAIEGDDPAVATLLKARNRLERSRRALDAGRGLWAPIDQAELAARALAIEALDPADVRGVENQAEQWAEFERDLAQSRRLADAWCSAFVSRKTERAPVITDAVLRSMELGHDPPRELEESIDQLATEYGFFHWHVAFPQVFATTSDPSDADDVDQGWSGGFDVVLGNPPWERTSFEEIPFFQARVPGIARASTTPERRRLIQALRAEANPIYDEYQRARIANDAGQKLMTKSGRFPLTSVGRTDTFALFAELSTAVVSPAGLIGQILPTGIATAIPLKAFWASVFLDHRVKSLSDFENRTGYFPAVHSAKKFCLLTLGGAANTFLATQFGFFLPSASTTSINDKSFPISPEDIERVNPTTLQPPIVPSRRDLDILIRLHKHSRSEFDDAPGWVGYTSEGTSESWIDGNSAVLDGGETAQSLLPLIEGKMVHQFDHRFATYEGCSHDDVEKGSPALSADRRNDTVFRTKSRFYVPAEPGLEFLARKSHYRRAVGVYRDYTSATNERTLIAALVPVAIPLQPLNGFSCSSAADAAATLARLNSFAVDYAARLKTPDIHLNVTIFNQLPGVPTGVPRLEIVGIGDAEWTNQRVLELVYTAHDIEPFARDLGYEGPPFRWDAERRFLIRAELDAAFFHLYGLTRDEVDYIMDTFPIVRRADEAAHNEYRTKRVILEIYDAMQTAASTGTPYTTLLSPPPGDPRAAHSGLRNTGVVRLEKLP